MTCAHCCGAESIFDQKEARKNLKKYRKKGANKTTKMLLNALYQHNIKVLSLLDIGGGIGVIQQELLIKGISNTTDVDSSHGYIEVAKELMIENGFDDKMKFIHGDFNDCHQEIGKHDIVTLERVVCCYPNAVDLINNSASKANKYYGMVYPMDNFLAKAVNEIAHLYLKVIGNPFRTFVHSEKMMEELVIKKGFKKIFSGNVFPWRVVLYEKD